jgi:arsenate reductase
MDVVITVCDAAAGESCPIWPGHPLTAHWGVPDPAAVDGDEPTRLAAFGDVFGRLDRRIARFLALPMDLDAAALQDRLRQIGAEGD